MYLSLFLGPFARDAGEDFPLIDYCLDQAVAAAEAGFAMVTFGEQHFSGYEPYCNPFMMAARLAPFMRDTYIGTTVCPIPFHQPMRLVEETNIADVLMRGRFILGASAGRAGPVPDFKNFGLDPADRDAAFKSKLDIMLQAWAHKPGDPPIEFETKWDKGAMSGRLMPGSFRAPRPLVAVATNTDATILETAKRGWPLFLGPLIKRELTRKFGLYNVALHEAGHDKTTIEHAMMHSIATKYCIVAETEDAAWSLVQEFMGNSPMLDKSDRRSIRALWEADLSKEPPGRGPFGGNANQVQSFLVIGTPDQVLEQLHGWEAAGVPQLHIRFTIGGYAPESTTRSFELFTREVMPRFGAKPLPGPAADQIRPEYRKWL